MYECANNVRVKKSYLRYNLCKILSCFVNKVSNVAILRFLMAFLGTFWNCMLLVGIFWTIWVFWAFYTVLLQIRFVVIYALFRVKYFWLKPCLCKKIVFLHVCAHAGGILLNENRRPAFQNRRISINSSFRKYLFRTGGC